ncbi:MULTISPECIES: flagella synthesis protein FlgN [Enterovibrio]|uniref:Flagellar biosynthesis protein FlgN n=1 Tax=Enterovibrio norvegicus FF-454 TaxID=1185651 RepID=A0A1E5C697_9GAMM|nr:flagellar export chaperone FlgN [Enterovibrio norvegicus]OEE60995.1 flagellar biosynthesis protein FlgN [Enterovibrio norvegicus FF-454]OEE74965.1 flagellar biosynthesis protein FlgN [Enterovibrio norvegicus FF-162]
MSEKASDFEQFLETQTDNVSALLDVMKQETSAIAARQSPDIAATAKQKLTLIQRIQLCDAQISKCPESTSPSNDATQKIADIKAILEQCHQLNEANGIALQRAHLSIHKLRNLFQEAAGKNEMTYDSDGKASGSRTLGTNVKA